MNKQGKLINGKVIGKNIIGWTKTILSDDTVRLGATVNPVGGCLHRCQWIMPNGAIAECYAKAVAEGVASAAYPEGFEHHYWHPERLKEPFKVKQPMRIFWDSMSDLFGHWVPDEQIQAVLDMACEASWHTFQSLTKNPGRMLRFDLPENVWAGASIPPDFMWGKRLSQGQKNHMMYKALETLEILSDQGQPVTWMSFEPLSWDMAAIVDQYPGAFNWAVIGAASNGKTKYQPDPVHARRLIEELDSQGIPVFFKGNFEWEPRREEFPR